MAKTPIDVSEWAQGASEPPEVTALKKEVNALRRKLTVREGAEALVVQAVKQAYLRPPDLKFPKAPLVATQGKGKQEIACLHISDTQIGKTTSTYDTEIAAKRIQLLTKRAARVVNTRRSSAKIEDLRVYLGGDMVEGEEIFKHQAHLIDSSVFEQAVKNTPAILARAIASLSASFRRIKVVCVVGNHGRPGAKGGAAHPKTNWDRVCYEVLRLMLMGPEDKPSELSKRLEFVIADSFYAVDYVFGWGNLLVHGDQIRGGGPSSVGGITKKMTGWQDAIEEPWDYLWFGHFHTFASGTHNARIWLANGTTESDNNYALEQLAATGFPCQRMAFFNEGCGLIADHQLFLAENGLRVPQKTRAEQWLNPPEK